MYKLIILIETIDNQDIFDEYWPQFLHQAEAMPGLLRETTSHVDHVLSGRLGCALMHELYFDSLVAVQQAMSSSVGQQSGQILQRLTQGKVTLMLASHHEDKLSNIRQHYNPATASAAEREP